MAVVGVGVADAAGPGAPTKLVASGGRRRARAALRGERGDAADGPLPLPLGGPEPALVKLARWGGRGGAEEPEVCEVALLRRDDWLANGAALGGANGATGAAKRELGGAGSDADGAADAPGSMSSSKTPRMTVFGSTMTFSCRETAELGSGAAAASLASVCSSALRGLRYSLSSEKLSGLATT